jgi:Carboxypeptidase regulatory-like domain
MNRPVFEIFRRVLRPRLQRTKFLDLRPTVALALALLMLAGGAAGQRDRRAEEEPTAAINFLVLKDDNGKPVRNAAVIMHPVNSRGKQQRGGMELKTDSEGKSSFDGVPYGKLRVQVLAQGFQTFGEDYDVNQAKMDLTIKLKRPQGQYSVYEDHASEKKDEKPH